MGILVVHPLAMAINYAYFSFFSVSLNASGHLHSGHTSTSFIDSIKSALYFEMLPMGLMYVFLCGCIAYVYATRSIISRNLIADLENYNAQLEEVVIERTSEISMLQELSIEMMAGLAEWNNSATGVHLKRMRLYVELICRHLKEHSSYSDYFIVRPNYVQDMSLASILHDIGKTAIPSTILDKPGKLTEAEFAIVKEHTVIAAQILNQANHLFIQKYNRDSYLALARDIAHSHHEHWDGQGYPHGIKEQAIPLSARIVSIVDVYDALTSKRPYKQPWTHEAAVQEISRLSGIHFDPEIVLSFMAVEKQIQEITIETH